MFAKIEAYGVEYRSRKDFIYINMDNVEEIATVIKIVVFKLVDGREIHSTIKFDKILKDYSNNELYLNNFINIVDITNLSNRLININFIKTIYSEDSNITTINLSDFRRYKIKIGVEDLISQIEKRIIIKNNKNKSFSNFQASLPFTYIKEEGSSNISISTS